MIDSYRKSELCNTPLFLKTNFLKPSDGEKKSHTWWREIVFFTGDLCSSKLLTTVSLIPHIHSYITDLSQDHRSKGLLFLVREEHASGLVFGCHDSSWLIFCWNSHRWLRSKLKNSEDLSSFGLRLLLFCCAPFEKYPRKSRTDKKNKHTKSRCLCD